MGKRTYTTAQICHNGHTLTSNLEESPGPAAPHCPDCGMPTIERCPNCDTNIRGCYYEDHVHWKRFYSRPSFCHQCGDTFPWTAIKIKSAKDLADDLSGLTEADVETLKETIDDLSADTPRTELAAHRYKKIVAKLGKDATRLLRSLVIEIATEAAKKALF